MYMRLILFLVSCVDVQKKIAHIIYYFTAISQTLWALPRTGPSRPVSTVTIMHYFEGLGLPTLTYILFNGSFIINNYWYAPLRNNNKNNDTESENRKEIQKTDKHLIFETGA